MKMQIPNIGTLQQEFEYHGRAMKLIMDSFRKPQDKESIECSYCGKTIDLIGCSPEQDILAEETPPSCVKCYKQDQEDTADMWRTLQAS